MNQKMGSPRTRTSVRTVDFTEVRALLASRLTEGRSEDALELMLNLLSQLQTENTQLAVRLQAALRQLHKPRSEKISPEQLTLLLAALSAEDQAAAAPVVEAAPAQAATTLPDPTRRARPHGRGPLPASILRVEIQVKVEGDARLCEECRGEKGAIGQETTELLEYVPGHFEVEVVKREKLACSRCESGVVCAPPPNQVIEKGRPGPGLLAHVVVAKYHDHVPLNRLAGIFARDGLHIPESTLYDWNASALDTLELIARELERVALLATVLQADATGLRVLDTEQPTGCLKGHLWAYVGDGKVVVFRYTPTKGGGVAEYLVNRKGIIQGDGDNALPSEAECASRGLLRYGCFMHFRRYFKRALDAGDARATVAIALIAKMYVIEAEANEEKVDPDERTRRRQAWSKPLMDELGRWIAKEHPRSPPKTPMGRATTYALRQWPALYRILDDGRVSLDNGAVERAIRPVAVGRVNWLFAGSEAGAHRLAIAFTVLGSCRLAGVDPRAYLRDVLRKIADGWPTAQIHRLLPHVWANERRQQAEEQASTLAG